MAPQQLGRRGGAYDARKNDVFGLGCVLYEASALKPAFQAFNMVGLVKKVSRQLKRLGITAWYKATDCDHMMPKGSSKTIMQALKSCSSMSGAGASVTKQQNELHAHVLRRSQQETHLHCHHTTLRSGAAW
jgi:serine/threonine protein kinase